MELNVLDVKADRATVTIQYDSPYGFAATEYFLPEYTETTTTKGKTSFKNVTPAQWRGICRDLIHADRYGRIGGMVDLWKSLARYASPTAQEIFCSEMEKYARRTFQKDVKKNGMPPEAVETRLADTMKRLRATIDEYKPVSLDQFAAQHIPHFSLDQFAAAVA